MTTMRDWQESLDAIILGAGSKLPTGYEISITIKRGAAGVKLYAPDDGCIRIGSEWHSMVDIANQIERAIIVAIEHRHGSFCAK